MTLRFSAGAKPAVQELGVGINVLPHAVSEDWMARLGYDNIGKTIVEASREGWKTNVHGFHPIPAAAFAKEFGIKSRIGASDWRGEY